jgi:hypothetical protein
MRPRSRGGETDSPGLSPIRCTRNPANVRKSATHINTSIPVCQAERKSLRLRVPTTAARLQSAGLVVHVVRPGKGTVPFPAATCDRASRVGRWANQGPRDATRALQGQYKVGGVPWFLAAIAGSNVQSPLPIHGQLRSA